MFNRKQPEQSAFPTSGRRQVDTAPVDQALASIAAFAVQMQEITQLFARGQQDVARQFDETAQRLDRAAAAVTKGEERITAQIAAFERATGEARQMAAEHERASRELMEQFRRTASELAGEGIRPLKTQVDNVTRQLSDATARVAEASSGFSNAMDLAIGSVNHRAERLLERQAETFAETVSGTMESGRAALTAAAGALDSAAGVLTQRIIETAEAQDAKLRTFEALTRDMESMRLALPAPEAAAAQAQRIEEATLSMNQASDSIGRAVGEFLSLRNAEAELTLGHTETAGAQTALAEAIETATNRTGDERHASITEAIRRLDDQAVMLAGIETVARRQVELSETFGGLAQGIDALLRRDSETRGEGLGTLLSRIESLQATVEALAAEDSPSQRRMREAIAALEAEREAMKRITIATRMMAKEAAKENQRGAETTSALAGRLEAMTQAIATGLEELKAATAESARPSPIAQPERSADGLPLITADKQSLQRILAGFRLLMRDIGGEAARFKELVDGVSGVAAELQHRPETTDAVPPENPVENLVERLDELTKALERVDGKIDGLGKPAPHQSEDVPVSSLPVLHEERESLQRLLIGFRLQLKELDNQTSALRDRIDGIRQPETLVLSPELDASLLAPLHGAAERIAEGVAETLSRFEQQLTDPVARLTDAVADNAKLLTVARDALAAPTKGTQPSVADAVAAMQHAARIIDQRVGQVDQLVAVLRKGGGSVEVSLSDVVADIEAAAAELRREAGDFLAIGAALSHELETGRDAASPAAGSRRKSAAGPKFRVA